MNKNITKSSSVFSPGKIFPWILIVVGIGIAATFAFIAAGRQLTAFESVLSQTLPLAITLIGSFIVGKNSAQAAARAIIKPSARSAFRRLISIYRNLGWIADIIEESNVSDNEENHDVKIGKIKVMVRSQILTADDAMADWKDIVPDDVKELSQMNEK